MYVWNGFSIVAKRKDLSENLLVTVEKAEAALQTQSKCAESLSWLRCLSGLSLGHICPCCSVCISRARLELLLSGCLLSRWSEDGTS